jgi:hypothetical protein
LVGWKSLVKRSRRIGVEIIQPGQRHQAIGQQLSAIKASACRGVVSSGKISACRKYLF